MTPEQLDEISTYISGHEIGEELIATLRKQYPDYHFTWCFDDDVGAAAKPYVTQPNFNLYLVNSSDHCSVLSNDIENASGVVLAEVIPDDD